jgi:hypothetical protein
MVNGKMYARSNILRELNFFTQEKLFMRYHLIILFVTTALIASCESPTTPYYEEVWAHPTLDLNGRQLISEKCNIEGNNASTNYLIKFPKDNSLNGGAANFSRQIGAMNADSDASSYCMRREGFVRENQCVARCVDASVLDLVKVDNQFDVQCTGLIGMSNLTTCHPREISFVHVANNHYISPAEKQMVLALLTLRNDYWDYRSSLFVQSRNQLISAFGGLKSYCRFQAINPWRKEQDAVNPLNLYQEKITWGAYNKKQKEILVQQDGSDWPASC